MLHCGVCIHVVKMAEGLLLKWLKKCLHLFRLDFSLNRFECSIINNFIH